MSNKISLGWLVDELDKLKVMGEVVTRAKMLSDNLIEITKGKAASGAICFDEFFCLIVGVRFVSELIEGHYFMPSVDMYARRRQEVIPRVAMPIDVDEVIERLKRYWENQYPELCKQIVSKAMPETAEVSHWLDLIVQCKHDLLVQRTHLIYRVTDDIPPVTIEELSGGGAVELISDSFERVVRYHEYGLSSKLEAEQKQILPLTYTLNELADRWGSNQKNIIAVCFRYKKLWAYINLTKGIRLKDFHHKVISLETKKKISDGEVDSDYKYPYAGFARVAKSAVVNSGITLQYFHSDSVIDAERGRLTLLWVDPPLCYRVLGIYSQYIDADKSFSPILYFMQREIHAFEATEGFRVLFPNNKIGSLGVVSKGSRVNAARNNGKKSGIARKETSDQWWKKVKPAILELAKDLTDKTGNYIAGVAVRKKLTDKSQSLTGRYIRDDGDFSQYIK